jgi:hypothetical protein
MHRLRETQALLWRLISAPEGPAAAIAALPDCERVLPRGIEALVQGDDRLDAVERLDVYSSMYFFRLLDCLIEDFPALHAVIGHEAFHGLAREYLDAHPSTYRSIRLVGRRLADFLEGHPLARARDWLADLARFEWALLEAFDAPDAAPVSEERLRQLTEAEWPVARFELTPTLRIVEAHAPVQDVWTAATNGRDPLRVVERATSLRVWREGFRVFHRVVDPAEVAALRSLARGERFADACEAAAAVVGDEAAAASVATALRRWVDDAMIVGIDAGAE